MTYKLPAAPDQDYPKAHREATHQLLLDTVAASTASSGRRRFSRVAVTAAAVTAILVAGTGTAVAYHFLASAPVTDTQTARCYSRASTDFGSSFPGTTVDSVGTRAVSGQNGPLGVRAPISVCAYLWEIGAVHPGAQTHPNPSATPPANDVPVPHLVGCVLPDGSAAVFPGPDGTCEKLGLPVAMPG